MPRAPTSWEPPRLAQAPGRPAAGHSLIEEHTGSGWVIKQYVWGRQYIDELIQIAHNSDPADNSSCETASYALQNANYNVMALLDSSGAVLERYEYSPYGQRTVYFSPGGNDPLAMAPTLRSRRLTVAGVDQPYGRNDFGHQGLMHEHPDDLVYNRARTLHTRLGRFAQRDPLNGDVARGGYQDGLSLYVPYRVRALGQRDPSGLHVYHCGVLCVGQNQGRYDAVFASGYECPGAHDQCCTLAGSQVCKFGGGNASLNAIFRGCMKANCKPNIFDKVREKWKQAIDSIPTIPALPACPSLPLPWMPGEWIPSPQPY